jgi:hypothetical protein
MAYVIEVQNLKELQEAFKKFPQIVDKELQAGTKDAGKLVLSTEKQEVPVKTGQLRRSITLDYKPISVSIYPTVKYALPLHEGSKPHVILPVRKQVLAFRKGGKLIFAKRVNHPGYKGNRFVERTVSIVTAPINRIFEKVLDTVIGKIVS